MMRVEPGMTVDLPVPSIEDSSLVASEASKTAEDDFVEDGRIPEALAGTLVGTLAENLETSRRSAGRIEDCNIVVVGWAGRIEDWMAEEGSNFFEVD